jgi:general secretion pathway protein F/MSHA biogenesis protein MshG
MKYYQATIMMKGKKETVSFKAEDRVDAIKTAKTKQNGIVLKVEEIPMPFEERMKVFTDIIQANFSKKKLNFEMFISATRQLATLTKAQISLKDSLDNISENTEDKLVQELFKKAADGIDSGLNLSTTFEEYQEYVGVLAVAMVKLGEQTGALGESLDALADIYENIHENRQKMKKAMRYPLMTLGAMGIAFTIMIVYVVPKFKEIFEKLNTELPLPTKILLGLEYAFSNYGPLLIAIVIGVFIVHKFAYKTQKDYKYKFDTLVLKTYLIGNIVRYASISRFLLVLTELTKAGIPLVDALKIANGILENTFLKEKIETVIRNINQGVSFTAALKEADLLDNVTLQMISSGEDSGELDTMLDNASNYYKDKFNYIVDNIGSAIEPIMMAFIGGLVLLLALGIFMPMWDMASAAKN